MDKKQFEQLIAPYARYIYTTMPPAQAAGVPRKNAAVDLDELANPTATLVVTEWLPQPQHCGECDQSQSSAVLRSLFWSHKSHSWVERCVTCSRTRNPATNQFERRPWTAIKKTCSE